MSAAEGTYDALVVPINQFDLEKMAFKHSGDQGGVPVIKARYERTIVSLNLAPTQKEWLDVAFSLDYDSESFQGTKRDNFWSCPFTLELDSQLAERLDKIEKKAAEATEAAVGKLKEPKPFVWRFGVTHHAPNWASRLKTAVHLRGNNLTKFHVIKGTEVTSVEGEAVIELADANNRFQGSKALAVVTLQKVWAKNTDKDPLYKDTTIIKAGINWVVEEIVIKVATPKKRKWTSVFNPIAMAAATVSDDEAD